MFKVHSAQFAHPELPKGLLIPWKQILHFIQDRP